MSSIIFDRLYGRIVFPTVIQSLLDDPALLRLREVNMASAPMFRFPSFNSVTRYEHSIGVCHLAKIAATRLKLPQKEKLELMLACLYHDVGTPPLAHATEEVFSEYFGYDHEQHLYDLIMGKTDDVGFEKSQIYLGRGLKLHRVVKNKKLRKIGIEIENIAKYANGKGELGSLVSGDIDLDNMDNVVRSASAMGLYHNVHKLPEHLSKSFYFDNGVLSLIGTSIDYIDKWKRIRRTLYNHLYADIGNFSMQTMLKHILRILVKCEGEGSLSKHDWMLTDSKLLEKISNNEITNNILNNMRLGKTYTHICTFEVISKDAKSFIKNELNKIEILSGELLGIDCIVNYYIDKRERHIIRPIVSYNAKGKINDVIKKTSIILGIFSPIRGFEGRSNRKKYEKLQKREQLFKIIRDNYDGKYDINEIKIYEDKIVTSMDVIQ